MQYIFVNPRDADDPFAEDSRFSEMSTKLSDLPVLLGEAAYTMHHNDVIAYGKAIDVSTLDPELPSQRIDDWLRTGPAGSKKLMWGVTFSCEPGGERTLAPADESPLCVTAVFPQGNISRWATIEIGTFDKGPSGPPRLKFIAVQPMGKDERTRLTSDKLSDLPRLLDQIKALSKSPPC